MSPLKFRFVKRPREQANTVHRCPSCGGGNVGIYDSRPVENRGADPVIRRRRTCGDCSHRWTTYEITATAYAALCQSAGVRPDFKPGRRRKVNGLSPEPPVSTADAPFQLPADA